MAISKVISDILYTKFSEHLQILLYFSAGINALISCF